MPSAQLLAALQLLQPHSGKRISDSVITGMTQSFSNARYDLIRKRTNPRGAGYLTEPTGGANALPGAVSARRKLMTLAAGSSDNYTASLNTQLLGGSSYPILSFVLGAAAGAVSGGAGLLFSVATTALSLSQTAQRVLARRGDELWAVEEIGKDNSNRVVHVGAFFLYDPFRNTAFGQGNGWLIHEERTVLDL